MNTKKTKVEPMFSLSRYLMVKAQNRLAKASFRHEKKLAKASKPKEEELFVEAPAEDLDKLYDKLQEAEHDHTTCNHKH